MFKTVLTRLGINEQERTRLGETANSIKDISEYLSDVAELAKNSDYLIAIADAAPWAKYAVGALGEAIPPVKFAAKLFADLTKETDPEALGHLACTLAYQRAVEQTVKSMEVPIVSNPETKDIKRRLAKLEPSASVDFGTFSFANALSHDFVLKADQVLKEFAQIVGYDDEQTRRLIGGVHVRFVSVLKTLLSDGSLKDRFEPFTTLIGLGAGEGQAYKALSDHAEYQRWLFEKRPVFKMESYSLADIYVNTECGSLTWGDIKKGKDPFSEQDCGRTAILDTVIELIGDPTFKDAIVIQGAAGAGKSSLTLKLCSELLRQGLRPIRVRHLDLRLDQEASKALPGAVRLGDDDFPTNSLRSRPDDLFLGGNIFKERVPFGNAEICPYVLILDGWNEISIADEGFKLRAKLLSGIRSEYLNYRQAVRLILTGRPSRDVSGGFFQAKTRVLTIRLLKPKDLRRFIDALRQALGKDPALAGDGEHGAIEDVEIFKSILDTYKEDFWGTIKRDFQGVIPREVQQVISDGEDDADTKTSDLVSPAARRSMAVLGFPQLAHLAVRLISQSPGDPNELVSSPTTIYRSLVDLTIEQSGKLPEDASDSEGQERLSGTELRTLLWRTAAAMTVLGKERISHAELKLRLNLDDLQGTITEETKEDLFATLMTSFYIRETELGAEFIHPSFREYLFAEAIVEILKEFGRRHRRSVTERNVYWKEFSDDDDNDLRYALTRKLSEHLAPQWFSPDVAAHLEQLIRWEVGRSSEKAAKVLGNPTRSLSLEEWTRVRDGLADVWDWWAKDVHLRPQPVKDPAGIYNLPNPPYVNELIKISNARDVQQKRVAESPEPTITMDAHLGDGLVRLCSLIHYQLAVAEGWLREPADGDRWAADLWEGVSTIGKGPRRCQSSVTQGDRSWVFFAPTQEDPHFFANYAHRINSAGWRPRGPFPLGVNLSGIDLRGAIISIPFLHDANDAVTIWTHANLSNVKAAGSCLHMYDLTEVLAKSADFRASYLVGTDFLRANLEFADFSGSRCVYANFEEAKLRDAFLRRTDLENTNFANADLEKTDFKEANVYESTSFEDSNFEEAKNLREALQRFLTQAKD